MVAIRCNMVSTALEHREDSARTRISSMKARGPASTIQERCCNGASPQAPHRSRVGARTLDFDTSISMSAPHKISARTNAGLSCITA